MPKRPKVPPAPPVRPDLTGWEHFTLWSRLREAIYALPGHFNSQTTIDGMLAPDVFTLDSALGATIEEEVVQTLNRIRSVWDPDKKYETYGFVRQPQTFPDVLLRRKTDGQDILLGIELKGWYLLAKEGMPNFRFKVNPGCCNPWDFIVVVPWVLSNVISGRPVVYDLFADSARYAAAQRNHYWQYERATSDDPTITPARDIMIYPLKKNRISDAAKYDPGKNFGRLARYGVMSEYVKKMMQTSVRGVSAQAWVTFFKNHTREATITPSA
jgi:hypothetical protein